MNLSVYRNLCRALLIGLLPWVLLMAAEPTRTIILVRHAERAGGMDPDVGISEAGRCRAGVLSAMLADAGIKSIFTSEVKRTQQTAEPLATKLGIRPEVIPAKDMDSLAAKLRATPVGETALMVGHSNTVPAIVERLTGEGVAAISDNEFDRMYVVTLIGPREGKVLLLRYPGCAP